MNESKNTSTNKFQPKKNLSYGAFESFAGDIDTWGKEYTRVTLLVPKEDAIKLKDVAFVQLNW